MQKRAMEVDFSWNVAGKHYMALYNKAIATREEYNKAFTLTPKSADTSETEE